LSLISELILVLKVKCPNLKISKYLPREQLITAQ
jgi:hypothetical protein